MRYRELVAVFFQSQYELCEVGVEREVVFASTATDRVGAIAGHEDIRPGTADQLVVARQGVDVGAFWIRSDRIEEAAAQLDRAELRLLERVDQGVLNVADPVGEPEEVGSDVVDLVFERNKFRDESVKDVDVGKKICDLVSDAFD